MISTLAFVDPEAKLGNNVTVYPFAFIDKNVVIGDNCVIMPHASIMSGARMGNNVTVSNGAIVSASPQDPRWKGEPSLVEIGDGTTIREQCIINRSIHEGKATKIGAKCFIDAEAHIAHDSQLADFCVVGNGAEVAGDVVMDTCSILSTGVKVFEGSHIGKWAFIKGGCRISGNVPPFVIMAHNPAAYFGVNATIMRHFKKYTEEEIDDIAKSYRHVYQCNVSLYNAVKRIKADIQDSQVRQDILDFIAQSNNRLVALPKFEEF